MVQDLNEIHKDSELKKSANFVNSDKCILNGEEMVYFKHPNTLRDEIFKNILDIGAEKFFSIPDQNIQRMREGMAEYFFTLALKKNTALDWYIRQLKDDPPDFELHSIKNNPIVIMLDEFELVEIPGHCKDFKEAMKILQKKIDKRYSKKYSLLIFVNNEKSKEWVKLFGNQLKDCNSFKTIWTVYLLWYKGKENLYSSVVHRLLPHPIISINAQLDDEQLKQYAPLSDFMKEIKVENKSFINLESAFSNELIKKMRKANLVRNRNKKQQNLP